MHIFNGKMELNIGDVMVKQIPSFKFKFSIVNNVLKNTYFEDEMS